ncbi:hypothetical protein G5B10_11070 [Fluviicola sp. SGL-29]|nr:hypothetical protein [Fluviicola sp. SGL-29]
MSTNGGSGYFLAVAYKKRGFLLYFVIIMFFLLLFSSCRKDTSWNSAWVVPLVNDTLDIRKFVNDSTIEVNNGYYYLNLKRNLYNFSLTDIVAIPDTTIDRTTSLAVQSLNVNPGLQFYNTIEEHTLNLQDLQLKLIQLNGGAIDFELTNPVGTGIYITIELPGVTKNGVMLSKTFFIQAGSQSNPGRISETIQLVDYQIDLTGQNGTSYNLLQSRVKIKSDPNGIPVTVTNNHIFNIKATFRDIKLYYARGYFGNRTLQDTTTFNLAALNSVVGGAIDIQNTSVKLILENGIKIDGSGIIHFLKNTNSQGTTVSLSGPGVGTAFTIDQPTGSFSTLQPSVREFLFNSGNSNVEQFIENLGAVNEIGYKIDINPWGNTSGGWNEVYPQSRLRLAVEAQMPLSIKMDALTIRDTFDLKLEQNKDKSHVESGVLQLDLDNAFPFAGQLKILFLDENGAVVEMINGTQPIASSLYGQPNAQGLKHNKSSVEIPLNANVVDKLNTIKKIIVEAVFDTPDPMTSSNQMVSIPADAYLGIKAKAKFKLKMNV